ncbi:MAG: ABC transporter substrate-binding protein [Dehalococcoidia bacterium]
MSGLSRRSFIQHGLVGGGVLMALPLLEACAPTQQSASPGPVSAPLQKAVKRGGAITTGGAFSITTLDPIIASNSTESPLLMYDYLFRYAPDSSGKWDVRPMLAEKWEWTDGGKTLTLQIKKGVKFHDNTPLDASVVAFNLDRMARHPKSISRTVLSAVDTVTANGSDTVVVTLKQPKPSMLIALSTAENPSAIISKAAVEKMGDDAFGRAAVGSGPMRIREFKSDDRLDLIATGEHWETGSDGKPMPYIERATVRYIPDAAVIMLELRSGGVDYSRDLAPVEAVNAKGMPDLVFEELDWTGSLFFHFGFNAVKGPFARDVKLRQAAQYALNRDAMAKALGFGLAKAHAVPYWGQGMPGFDATMPAYNFDLAKAKALMAEAGHRNGVDITLIGIAREPESTIAEIVKPMWDEIGLRTKVKMIERTAFFDQVKTHEDHEVLFWRGVNWSDPSLILRQTGTGAADNWTGYSNPEWDNAMNAAGQVLDSDKRSQAYRQAYEILYRDAMIGCGYRVLANNTYRKGLTGVAADWSSRNLRYVWWDK